MYALCTLACLQQEQVLLQFETDVTRLLLSWASPSSCWMSQRSELCFGSVWLSAHSLYPRNRKALPAYTKWAELVHDRVGISGNDPHTALLLLAKHRIIIPPPRCCCRCRRRRHSSQPPPHENPLRHGWGVCCNCGNLLDARVGGTCSG